ncbi:hypothetical protein H0H81_000098 [Sphagnurus paluster]|uniref:Uncharacterized protein n=1 Tax=Sphagnurus paluster TaxID=117069 RepID=A0A9P7GU79_9AGAR|nr:hypothetical protein H0H81_000098 [Sphagnurus paluster]
MQNPTLQNVRIRSVRDALQVFYGVATKRLPLITRRLDAEERRSIVSGNVYVWQVKVFSLYVFSAYPMFREERGANSEPTGLGMERCQQRLDELDTIDRIRGIGDVPVPEGLFRSARSGKMRRDHRKPSKKTSQPPDLVTRPESSHRNDDLGSSSPGSGRRESPSFHHSVSPPYSEHSRDSSPSSEYLPQSSSSSSYDQPKLVPLEYLQNMTGARRNPVDEQLLRRFSSQAIPSHASSRLPFLS